MLKQLAGDSQPHDVEEEDRNEDRDLEMRNKGVEMRNGEETGVRDSSHSGAYADDASIKRYLQKLQGDPHIDSRGLQDGLSKMNSYQGSINQQDQLLAHGSRFEDETRPSAHRLSEDTRRSGTVDKPRERDQEPGSLFHKGEGEAEQVFRDREADLRQDQDAVKPGVQEGGRGAGKELRSASHAVRDQLQKDKGGVERDGRKLTSTAAADMPILVGQTARD